MLVLLNSQGYVDSYALFGGLDNGIDVPDPEDEEWFGEHFEAFRYENGDLVYDEDKYEEVIERKSMPIIDSITELQLALAEVYELLEGMIS